MNIRKFSSVIATSAFILGSAGCTEGTVISSRSREARGHIGEINTDTLTLSIPSSVVTVLSREAFQAGCAVSLEAILDKDPRFSIDKDAELSNLLLKAKRPQDIPLVTTIFNESRKVCEDNITAIF